MKKKFFTWLLLFVQASAASFHLNENSTERCSFSWEMEGLSVLDTAGERATISFKNQNVDLGDSGQPSIPAFSFYIGTPSQGTVRVLFNPIQTRSISLKHPLEVVRARKKIPRYPGLHFNDRWLSDGVSSVLGNISTRQFILKPFLYDEKTNTVLVLEKGTCSIEFPSTAQTSGIKIIPKTDFARMVSRLILNYDIAAQWSLPTPHLKKRKSGEGFPLAPNKPLVTFTIGDGHEDINEGTIKENGIIKISGDILQKLGNIIPMNQIALYASYKGEMPLKTPGISELPDGVIEIPLLRFDLNSNGIVDPEDYVLAYVTGASDWAWSKEKNEYYYNLNRYEDYRHYWLIRSARNASGLLFMPQEAVASPVTANSFKNHILYKKSKEISHEGGNVERGEKSGLNWRWELLTSSVPSFSYQILLPAIDTTVPIKIKINQGSSTGMPELEGSFSNAVLCTLCASSEWYSADYSGDYTFKIKGSQFTQNSDYIEIESFECTYDAKLDLSMNNGSMTVFSPETGSTVKYHLSNLPGELVYIFRIDADEKATLIDSLRSVEGSSYEWVDAAGKGNKYYICAQSAFHPTPSWRLQNPQQADEVMIYNLRAIENPSVNKADYLIISHPDFLSQAVRLANHKRNVRRFSSPKVVDVGDVYREFSGGNLDPAGIRNFLVYAHTQWGVKPDYVVLLGKGHYNFKNEPVFIPVSENKDRCIEDFFAYLDSATSQDSSNPPNPSIFIGRFPCSTIDQARQMVDKIIDLEDPSVAELGAWRNRGLLVNDDDKQVADNHVVPDPLGTDHRDASEKVGAVISSQWPSIDIRKVNLFQYPINTLFQKPEARDALINDINSGMSFVNFFGHGSPQLWTDERILDQATVANLHNEKRYPVISSFSCAVGEFDQPAPHRCLSEVLALASKSGAVATISSMREAYSENNKHLAMAFYGNVFDGSRVGVTLGEAYAQAKMTVRDQNSQIYSFLGDPSICFVNPQHRVVLSIIDKEGRSRDTLKALQAITIKGSIKMGNQMTVDAAYGSNEKPAFVQISLFNPPIILQQENSGTDTIPGTPIFTGQIAVMNGQFEQSLHLPRNVIFKKPGAKVTVFSWLGFDNGLGYKPIVFDSTDSIGSFDTVGPSIALRPLYDDDASLAVNTKGTIALLTGKVQATLPFRCEVNVFDSSGIDVVGTGPDEGLSIEIDGVLSKQNINNKFRFDGGDYRKGNATIELSEGQLRAGTYSLWASAQDLAGNITRQNFVLEISQNQDVAINHVFNYPNPVKMGKSTSFYFELSKTTGVTSMIKIYSMSGKLLNVIYGAHSGEVFNLRDRAGNLLGPNVYLYQLIAEDAFYQKTVKSKIQKLLIHPPR
jgi:hypothetical protein